MAPAADQVFLETPQLSRRKGSMSGESPLGMMRPQRQRTRRPGAAAGPPRRRIWPIVLPLGVVVVLAAGWCALWYYAAGVADRTLAGWMAREAAAGRVYSCGSQSIAGFPLRIAFDCTTAAATISSIQPPLTVSAKEVGFAAAVYRPTVLVGSIASPLAVAAPGQPPSFVANWSRAALTVRGLPPEPEAVSVSLDRPNLDRMAGASGTALFTADHAEFSGRLVGGSAAANPVIEAVAKLVAATAPTLHPLLADAMQGEIDAVLTGFKDLAPKPWSERFREMQATGGKIEIKHLRLQRPDAIIVGAGTLTINANGKLDGLLRVAVAGLDQIVPKLGVERLIGRGIDRLGGGSGQSQQGLNALDRLMPGLSGVVRDSATASLIENLTKMGQPTEIDKKPAVVLPLNFSDGLVSLGMLPLGEVPALF
jgi:hypothetical protein